MGFDVNFNNKPVIAETQQTHDGGAGNLGYFEQDAQKENAKNKSIFSEEHDSFEKGGKQNEDEGFSIAKLIAEIILAVKTWIKKLFSKV